MTQENQEKIAEMAETLDNLVHAMQLAMPAEFHLRQLKESLPLLVEDLKQIYVEESGENPWDESEDTED